MQLFLVSLIDWVVLSLFLARFTTSPTNSSNDLPKTRCVEAVASDRCVRSRFPHSPVQSRVRVDERFPNPEGDELCLGETNVFPSLRVASTSSCIRRTFTRCMVCRCFGYCRSHHPLHVRIRVRSVPLSIDPMPSIATLRLSGLNDCLYEAANHDRALGKSAIFRAPSIFTSVLAAPNPPAAACFLAVP